MVVFAQMMKEWAAARQRVQDMKATDQKAADKLNKEITIRCAARCRRTAFMQKDIPFAMTSLCHLFAEIAEMSSF